ncbi:MAG TPA: hypothetical protein PLH57_04565 [Oligoflexia bacterium]|nr:hypothetical protein [Oligoflexia bacterium]
MSRKTTLRRTIGILGALAIGILPGCGDYSKSTREAREEFYAGEYSDAARSLEKGAREEGVDQLLYVLDRATALHHAGSYEESNQEFHLADKLSEIKDYTSLSAETATLITNDKIIPYKGEDFERVLISQYLALNYLMLGKKEDALVECRRVNHKLHMMISQGKRKYKLNPMAMYVAALLYEDAGEWSDAYVDYQQVYKLMPELSYLREDLYRLAAKNRMPDHQRRWAEAFNLSVEEQKRILEEASRPELVMIFELGRGPEKQPHRAFPSIPQFVPRYDSSNYADVFLEDGRSYRSHLLFDVEKTAIQNLEEKYAGLIAKRVGGFIAKEVIASQIERRTNNEWLGVLARLGMHAANQADLRSWLTLPKTFQILRVRISENELYKLRIVSPRGTTQEKSVTIDRGEKRKILLVRSA